MLASQWTMEIIVISVVLAIASAVTRPTSIRRRAACPALISKFLN
jgi:hypothetical protein